MSYIVYVPFSYHTHALYCLCVLHLPYTCVIMFMCPSLTMHMSYIVYVSFTYHTHELYCLCVLHLPYTCVILSMCPSLTMHMHMRHIAAMSVCQEFAPPVSFVLIGGHLDGQHVRSRWIHPDPRDFTALWFVLLVLALVTIATAGTQILIQAPACRPSPPLETD